MRYLLLFAFLGLLTGAIAWGNGYSIQENPTYVNSQSGWTKSSMYGTHDYLAEQALRLLPENERSWIYNTSLFYGTELPDSFGYTESINDRNAQYIKFDSYGNVLEDRLANRSMRSYQSAIDALLRGEYATASKHAGAVMSYISDAGLFARVIEDSENGLRFENFVLPKSNTPSASKFQEVFGSYISFDGQLEMVSPYDAVMKLSQETYLGENAKCSAQWMEDNYNTNDPQFIECAGRSFNRIINAEADVLHTIYMAGINGQTYELYSKDWANSMPRTGQPAGPGLGGDQPIPAEDKPMPVRPDVNQSATDTARGSQGGDDGSSGISSGSSGSGTIYKPATLSEESPIFIYAAIAAVALGIGIMLFLLLSKKSREKTLTNKLSKKLQEKEAEKKELRGLFSGKSRQKHTIKKTKAIVRKLSDDESLDKAPNGSNEKPGATMKGPISQKSPEITDEPIVPEIHTDSDSYDPLTKPLSGNDSQGADLTGADKSRAVGSQKNENKREVQSASSYLDESAVSSSDSGSADYEEPGESDGSKKPSN